MCGFIIHEQVDLCCVFYTCVCVVMSAESYIKIMNYCHFSCFISQQWRIVFLFVLEKNILHTEVYNS